MKTEINIGLETSENYGKSVAISEVEVIKYCGYNKVKLLDYRIEKGYFDNYQDVRKEDTLVAIVKITGAQSQAIYKLARELKQDCIAIKTTRNVEGKTYKRGFLIGRYAEQWGKFDEKYFLNY